ncbi:taurine dioxygenase [Mycobacterium sp. CBMA271]|uniref:TauD/TfdA dioxygenase family protein n=1 Tax=unclassified Mycobacteroides TaxID=2618759 RepID=UPI0012DE1709|nr:MULTISPECIES: TauD/TfdA family dioxygenase [unclassified Mycobacteroides]MUM16449.1 taurine dioxygenase [Mycobacteroides sp. CBMA 326]MUM20607.1 taurine dioxygenase [Mycobacteroides sp. CBMA 271]
MNNVAALNTMRAQPLTCTIGAELFDVDLAEVSRSDELFDELRRLLLEYKVLFVRDQDITRGEHVALAQRFGPLEDHPVAGSDPDHPGLVRIYKEIDSAPEHYENSYHCDATWRESPPMGCVLRCVETPAVGGDTIWVNMAEAYRRLPEAVRESIDGLAARHSIEASFGAAMSTRRRHELHERFPDAEHPVVRTHPETGEQILFVNSFATHLVNFHRPETVRFGMDFAPGASELLQYLQRQASVPEFQVRWRWTPNSFAIWDNRSTQHYAVQDYWPAVRKMERAGICGDRPF